MSLFLIQALKKFHMKPEKTILRIHTVCLTYREAFMTEEEWTIIPWKTNTANFRVSGYCLKRGNTAKRTSWLFRKRFLNSLRQKEFLFPAVKPKTGMPLRAAVFQKDRY